MRNIHFLLFILLFPMLVFSQNPKIDSLKNELKKTGQDTVKVNTLNVLSEELMHVNQYDTAIRYANSSKELAEKIKFEQGSANAYQNLAVYYLHQKNYASAKVFLLKSLAVFLQSNNREAIADTYLSLYYVNEKQLNYMPALDNYKKHIIYRDSLINEKKQAEAALATTAFNVNKKEAFATNNATILASFKEQKKEFIITAGIVTSLLALALIAMFVNIGRIKRANNSIVSAHELAMLDYENTNKDLLLEKEKADKLIEDRTEEYKNKIDYLTAQKQEAEKLHKEREQALEVQIASITPINDITQEPKEEEIEVDPIASAEKTTDVAPIIEEVELVIFNENTTPFIPAVQFTSFTTQLLDGKIAFNWETVFEDAIAYFEVDKSIDNQQFITIETIAAIGFGDNHYQAFDLQPLPGNNFYRINMVDKNGGIIYSQTAKVQSTTNVLLDLIRYPNPVKEVMMVTAVGGKSKVAITIFDKVGEKIFNMEVPPATTPIYLTDIEPGNYTLQMKSQGKSVVQKLVKI